MPHTLAHPIAVVPIWYLSKRRMPLSALVIGSISPDFSYYVALTTVPAISHSVMGLVTHCLPQSLLLFTLWRYFLRRPILDLIGVAVSRQPRWSVSYFGLVCAAIILGAATHNFLDSTSHSYGWIVQHAPFLHLEVFGLPIFKWIQYTGSVFGLIALAYWVRREFPTIGREPNSSMKRRLAWFVFPACVLSFSLLTVMINGIANVAMILVNQSIAFSSGIFVGTVIYATLDRFATDSA